VEVWPVKTNAAFLARAAADPDFVAGRVDTGFIARKADQLVPSAEASEAVAAAAAAVLAEPDALGPWSALTGFRLAAPREARVLLEVGGERRLANATPTSHAHAAEVAAERVLFLDGEAFAFGEPQARAGGSGGASDGQITAPMPGRIAAVDVAEGDTVKKGQRLLVLEAMKMEQALPAPFDGVVAALSAKVGGQVVEGAVLARIEEA
jgi:3-methylcrotonyl-CoA carboxylase alpha subunit